MPVPSTDSDTIYASLADLKLRLGITVTTWDTVLTSDLISASRKIDNDTGRRFYADALASARTYNPALCVVRSYDGDKILIEDAASAPTLLETGYQSTFTTVDSGSYEFGPDNALALGYPIQWILLPYGNLPWSWGRIRVTARWGWPSVPEAIKEACLLQASRLFSRRESPNGIAGTNDFGLIRVGRWDPDYESLLGAYEKSGFA